MSLPRTLVCELKKNVSLASRTTFKVGGVARYWFRPRDERHLTGFLKDWSGEPRPFVIGAGSNILFGDGVVNRLFVDLGDSVFSRVVPRKGFVRVGGGCRLGRLISFLSARNLGGYEFLAGIPGTVGGAVVMNAGARGRWEDPATYREMKDLLVSVEVCDMHGERSVLSRENIRFGYRSSSLEGMIVLAATLRFEKARRQDVTRRLRENLKKRWECQDWVHASAGSFFKNPAGGPPAAHLIDRCGLKGFRVGDAQVSPKHANFIINTGHASFADVLRLVEIVKQNVYNQFRVNLEPEVRIVQ
jgi:UDP-N-acetylmuramate dehydrogenase